MPLIIALVPVFAVLSCAPRNEKNEVADPAASPREKLPDNTVERFVAVISVAGESLEENTYLLWDRASGDGAIVDPGRASPELEAFASARGIKVRGILNTHGHFDHIGGNGYYRNTYHADVYAHAGDKSFYKVDDLPTRFLAADEDIQMGSLKVRVLHTPGHSTGGVCFYVKGHLFSGDTLFEGTIGKADHEQEARQLVSGIRSKLLTLPQETVVYPGHGPRTTIGREAAGNPFLSEMHIDNEELAGLEIKKVGDATVVRFKDADKLDRKIVPIVRGPLFRLAEQNGRKRLILDLSNVQFISEEGFGMLLALNRKIRQTNGRLRLCSLSPGIHEVLTILQLDKVFDIQKNVEEALNRPHDSDADNRRRAWEQAIFREAAGEPDKAIAH
jgi:anti-anti-sigma factor